MGLIGHLFHGVLADILVKRGDYLGAAKHTLRTDSPWWERNRSAGMILSEAGQSQLAIPYFREALGGCADHLDRADVWRRLIKCHEGLQDYEGAMEAVFEQQAGSNYPVVYDMYKTYRSRSPSFRLCSQRLYELYDGLCESTSYGDRKDALEKLAKQEVMEAVEEFEQRGHLALAVRVLQRATADFTRDTSFRPGEEYLKAAALQERSGNFQEALRMYEDYNLLDGAARCYEALGDDDKLSLYLLAKGKRREAARLCERKGWPSFLVTRLKGVDFDPGAFEHPLVLAPSLPQEECFDILVAVGDDLWVSLLLMQQSGRLYIPDYIKDARTPTLRLWDSAGDENIWSMYGDSLLLRERLVLYRASGTKEGAELADRVVGLMRSASEATKALDGWKYYADELYLRAFMTAGEFFRGILVGRNMLDLPRGVEREKGSEVCGDISRCCEMIGAYEEGVAWSERQIAQERQRATPRGYRDLARLHLKLGNFGDAAEALAHHVELCSSWSPEMRSAVAKLRDL